MTYVKCKVSVMPGRMHFDVWCLQQLWLKLSWLCFLPFCDSDFKNLRVYLLRLWLYAAPNHLEIQVSNKLSSESSLRVLWKLTRFSFSLLTEMEVVLFTLHAIILKLRRLYISCRLEVFVLLVSILERTSQKVCLHKKTLQSQKS